MTRKKAALTTSREADRGVFRDSNFRLFFTAQSVSQVGSQVTLFALPLLIVSQLHMQVGYVGLIRLAGLLPMALLTLPFGLLADRRRRRVMMILSDAVRCVLTALIVVITLTVGMSVYLLIVLVFTIAIFTALSGISERAVLPTLVKQGDLSAANSWLETSRSAAAVAGPALAGVLVGIMSPGDALFVDAASFAISALAMSLMRWREPQAALQPTDRGTGTALAGLRQVMRSPILRPDASYLAARNLFAGVFTTYLLVFSVQVLKLSPSRIGVIMLLGAGGLIIGARLTPWIAGKIGGGLLLCIGSVLSGAGMIICIMPSHYTIVTLLVGLLLYEVGVSSNNLQRLNLRQIIVPQVLMGRVNGALYMINYSSLLIGAGFGGLLVSRLGLQTTMRIAAAGSLISVAILALSPLRRIRIATDAEPIWHRAELSNAK
jgi:predicted MFS family arabinose efflux permease